VLNSVIYGRYDFSILSATAIALDQGGNMGSAAAILADVVTAILLLSRRKHIEPTSGPWTATGTPPAWRVAARCPRSRAECAEREKVTACRGESVARCRVAVARQYPMRQFSTSPRR
jgi:hypothetical protein